MFTSHRRRSLAPVALIISDGVATDDFDAAIGLVDSLEWSARVAWRLPGADEGQLARFAGGRGSVFDMPIMPDGRIDQVGRFCEMLRAALMDDDFDGGSLACRRSPLLSDLRVGWPQDMH